MEKEMTSTDMTVAEKALVTQLRRKAEAIERIANMTTDDVQSVYSGKPGCCCGCSGIHRYNSKYAVDGEDINDKQVKKVLGIIRENILYQSLSQIG